MPPAPIPSTPPAKTLRVIRFRGKTLVLDGQPKIVGILNVTPDSFYDGGRHLDLNAAVQQAERMVAEGAVMIDIGGQSTRPGHVEISAEEEISRVIPVIEALTTRLAVPLSIDTSQPAVARAALAAGAAIINDVYGCQRHPELAQIAAQHDGAVILMHQEKGFDATRGATLERLASFLRRSIEIALAAGVVHDQIILDPGIGFTKTQEQNLEILARLGELKSLGYPLLLGASRKSVINHVLSLPPEERLEGTLTTTTLAVWQGVEFLRVHEVRANLRAALMAAAIREAQTSPLSS